MSTLSIIEIHSEIGAGTRGASLGPDAVKVAALNMGDDLFHKHKPQHVVHENHLLHSPVTTPYGKRINGLIKVYDRVSKVVSFVLEKKPFLVVLAGDHSTAGGTLAGIKMAFPEKRIGVVWIDAHADLHSPYTTPSGNLHGMPLGASLAFDNKDKQVNQIKDETLVSWEKLKNTGGYSPKVLPQDVLFIGVRDTEAPEDYLMESHNIRNITVDELRKMSTKKVIEYAFDYLKDTDLIYVSFDVDSMDPSFSRGTGTPVEHGITPLEAKELLVGLTKNPKTVCFEVVEVNPCLDDKINKMAETAFELLREVVHTVESR